MAGRSMWPAVRAARRLTPREVALAGWALVLLALAEVAVRTRSTVWSAARFGLSFQSGGRSANQSATQRPHLSTAEEQAIRIVQALSTLVYGSEQGCLRRSLVLGHLLRSRKPVLRIGVRHDGEVGISAHAWLEIDGYPVGSAGGHLAFDVERWQRSTTYMRGII